MKSFISETSDKASKLSKKLFGFNMYMSASRTEVYHKCPFEYFCEYGLKAKPRKEAQVDAALSGTLIHYVMEKFLFNNKKDATQSLHLLL